MALAQATKSRETTYTINDAMDVLLSKLDEAIDDMENGRVVADALFRQAFQLF